ncbi:MAG: hypothetical protein JXR95_12480 [Deltaproteobacteria bacterium]|nr:hypothetical protein [Deltaproteobacteria bacterium]
MIEEQINFDIALSTHKRLKLISIVEKKPMTEILDELVKQKYGEHRKEIEELIKSTSNPTRIKED